MPGRIEPGQVGQQVTRGIAQTAVDVGGALEDFVGDVHLLPIVGGRDPQPQHVRAKVLHNLLRRDDVALGLGHLLALGIDREPVGEHLAEWRTVMDGNRGQKGGLEPAAMLVGALEVQIRRVPEFVALCSTQAWVTPESNQTSRVSVTFL